MHSKVRNTRSYLGSLFFQVLCRSTGVGLLDRKCNGIGMRMKRKILQFCFRNLTSEERSMFNNCLWSSHAALGYFASRIFPEAIIQHLVGLIKIYRNYGVCEIGCGNGQLLNTLYVKVGDSSRNFLGIDLNQEQTEINKERYNEKGGLNFECRDIFQHMLRIKDNVFLFSFGSFTVFTREMVDKLFLLIKNCPHKITLAFYEPVYEKMMVSGTSEFRNGYAFFHDYVGLAEKNGLTIIQKELCASDTLIFLVCHN